MRVRKNVKNLSDDEKKRYVNAFLALNGQDSIIHPGMQSRYDDFVETHLNAMWDFTMDMMKTLSWGHGDSVFLPWHRELLYQFEKLLQSVDSSVTIPYWDWTRDHESSDPGFPFKNSFLAVDGDDLDGDRVKKESGAPSPYPYAFDPEDWSLKINVVDPHDTLNFFQRAFGEFNIAGTANDAPNLPENDVTVVGTTTYFRAAINSANDYLTLRSRSEDLHNLVHRWTGGNMLRMTSPNDPVFFLHHAQIDRMWSIWQRKVAPGTDLFTQSSSAAGHKLNDAMIYNDLGDPPFTTGATVADVIDGHTMHGDGVWYYSDIPEIDTPSSSLDFINIPEGLTSYKAVSFKIKGGRPVHFRITGDPTGQFGITPMGHEFLANPVDEDDFYYGYVWVQLTAVAGAILQSSVDIHAYIIDEEGYYTAIENDEYPLGDYTVTLTATTVARENNSIALVLDRSGSMAAPAGGTSTRSQLLGNAIGVFRDLMLANDEVAVVTFDDQLATPIPMTAVSGAAAFSTVDISPRGQTWIGGGIQQGAMELAAATHTNKAMIVLTDGNENVHPYIMELPAGTVTNRTFAIGLGLPGEVSDVALHQITSSLNGDLIVTGLMSSDEQRFNLTKYFVQVLADVINSQVILDPNGKLYYGSKDTIAFKISEADVYVDAITLCPLPKYIDFILQTPDGKIIKPTTAEPNVKYIMGQQVICYRMTMPAIASDPAGSHEGTWKAILSLKGQTEITRLTSNKEFAATAVSPSVNAFLPYSFLVHTTSNLQFRVWKLQESFRPGATINLFASLTEYDVPVQRACSVWAEIIGPEKNPFTLKFKSSQHGIYSASFTTTMSGIYFCRVHAEGITMKGSSFTREKTLTAGVYFGNYSALPHPDPGELICRLLHCIFEEHEVFSPKTQKRLTELGIDFKQLVECIEESCPEFEKESIPGIKYKIMERILAKPQLVSQIKFKQAVAAKPVKRKVVKKPKLISPAQRNKLAQTQQLTQTMFMPLNLRVEEKRTDKGSGHKGKMGGDMDHSKS